MEEHQPDDLDAILESKCYYFVGLFTPFSSFRLKELAFLRWVCTGLNLFSGALDDFQSLNLSSSRYHLLAIDLCPETITESAVMDVNFYNFDDFYMLYQSLELQKHGAMMLKR